MPRPARPSMSSTVPRPALVSREVPVDDLALGLPSDERRGERRAARRAHAGSHRGASGESTAFIAAYPSKPCVRAIAIPSHGEREEGRSNPVMPESVRSHPAQLRVGGHHSGDDSPLGRASLRRQQRTPSSTRAELLPVHAASSREPCAGELFRLVDQTTCAPPECLPGRPSVSEGERVPGMTHALMSFRVPIASVRDGNPEARGWSLGFVAWRAIGQRRPRPVNTCARRCGRARPRSHRVRAQRRRRSVGEDLPSARV